jgi:transposase
MKEYIAFDSHKQYTLVEWENVVSGHRRLQRVEHQPGAIRACLAESEPGTPVAVEAIGNWYWIVNEIEEAGLQPRLVHPRKAKLMMGMINKTDKLDVHGLNRLQRNNTLPTVWIPPAELRDLRELTRVRLVLTRQRTQLKNRLHANLAKYGLRVSDWSDWFGRKARTELEKLFRQLPPQTQRVSQWLLEQLDFVCQQIQEQERELEKLLPVHPSIERLQSLPGVGLILAATIWLEMGTVGRFPGCEHMASYSGTTPRVHSSGDKTRYGRLRSDVNRYLKWAFAEAANSVALNHKRQPQRHVSQLYQRLRTRKGHPKAIGAVARHLAEATYWVESRQEPYRDPALGRANQG